MHLGALRAFHIDKDAKEATIMFAVKDWRITDMFSFVSQKPAMTGVEAIEDSSIFQITTEDFDTLLVKVEKFEKFFRLLMQNSYVREQMRVLQKLSLLAEEKYDNFLEKYPGITKQVTQKQIVIYLEITPEFLSKIRKIKSTHAIS